jgi:electron transfer flavoprotein alpha subunit
MRGYASSAPSTLVIVEHKNGKLESSTFNLLTAAKSLEAGALTCLIGAKDASSVQPLIDQIQAFHPAKVMVAQHSSLDKPAVAEIMAPLIVKAAQTLKSSHIVGSHSAFGKNILPRVAALMDVSPISDVVSIESADTFMRPIYAGNAIATVRSQEPVKILTVRATAFEPIAPQDKASAPVEIVQGDQIATPTQFVKEDLVKSDRPELGAAKVVVAGGRALKSAENFKILYDLADKLGGAVGASRAAVDAGYADNSLQIGQTGKVVAPQLYIGCGISGAIQHLAGMKDAKVIVAINTDPDAPIFQVADYGLEANLFEAVPEMTKKL